MVGNTGESIVKNKYRKYYPWTPTFEWTVLCAIEFGKYFHTYESVFKDEKGLYYYDNRYCPKTDKRTIPHSIRSKGV